MNEMEKYLDNRINFVLKRLHTTEDFIVEEYMTFT